MKRWTLSQLDKLFSNTWSKETFVSSTDYNDAMKAKDAELSELKQKLEKAEASDRKLREIWDMFYGQNLEVANWHKNGQLEPIDSFFESNEWEPAELNAEVKK